jgi:hypothetical protein
MKTVFFIITIVFAIAGCKPSVTFPEGGYNYPTKISSGDSSFYWVPIRDSVSSFDSLRMIMSDGQIFKSFHEPNLSLRPMPEPVFRLSYAVMGVDLYIVSLMPDKMVVKEWKSGYSFPRTNTEKLTPEERQYYYYFQRYYPWHKPELYADTSKRGYGKILLARYPQLNDINYYIHLRKKSQDWGDEKFVFTTRVIRISDKIYARLVERINKSGFWTLPWKNFCEPMPMDGDGYMLEANTPKHFKVVVSSNCDSTSHMHGFIEAIKDLQKQAGLKTEISGEDMKNRNWRIK